MSQTRPRPSFSDSDKDTRVVGHGFGRVVAPPPSDYTTPDTIVATAGTETPDTIVQPLDNDSFTTAEVPFSVTEDQIRTVAYQLWEVGFSESPETNWYEAERTLLDDADSRGQFTWK